MTVAPTADDRERFERLVIAASAYGHALVAYDRELGGKPSGKRLFEARKRCRHAIMPADQQFRESELHRLIKLVDLLASSSEGARVFAGRDLARQADKVAKLLGVEADTPARIIDDEPPARRSRRDIDD